MEFTLAHLSDPHLGPLPRPATRDLMSKRVIGYANWRSGRNRHHRAETVEELIVDIREAAPDHVVVTGDLVNIAIEAEFVASAAWLATLGAPADVTVIPGNHDAYVPGAIERAAHHWKSYMSADEAGGEHAFPFVRRRNGVALIGLSSARATAPFMATGRIDAFSLARLREVLAALGEEGLFRVVLVHHSPAARATGWSRRLERAAAFRAVIAEAGAELILHGHNHRASLDHIRGPEKPVPVLGAASASRGAHASFNLIRIAGMPGAFTCEVAVRGTPAPGGPVATIAEHKLDV